MYVYTYRGIISPKNGKFRNFSQSKRRRQRHGGTFIITIQILCQKSERSLGSAGAMGQVNLSLSRNIVYIITAVIRLHLYALPFLTNCRRIHITVSVLGNEDDDSLSVPCLYRDPK